MPVVALPGADRAARETLAVAVATFTGSLQAATTRAGYAETLAAWSRSLAPRTRSPRWSPTNTPR